MDAHHSARTRNTHLVVAATGILLVALAVALTSFAGPAGAKSVKGTSRGDVLKGTNKKDKIKGKGGNDSLTGRGGKDVLSGGSGNDVLNAVDGKRDKKVKGGSGKNECRLDQADVAIAKGCDKMDIAGGGGGTGGGGGGGGESSTGGLTLTSASGLTCASSLPTCVFELSGAGADSEVGNVTGGGGVTGVGAVIDVQSDGTWTAAGTYGCDAPGFLHVEIGSRFIDVPVTCETT